MSIENPNVIHAMAQYDGIADMAFRKNSGFVSAVRNGPGAYTLTLEQSVNGIISYALVDSGTVAFVRFFPNILTGEIGVVATDINGAPIDIVFDIVVHAMPQAD